MATVKELQDYLRESASRSKNVVACPPFHLYLHPTDDFRFFNYAIPDAPVDGVSPETLSALRSLFTQHDREFRLEFLHEYTPLLWPALKALGVTLESENPLLVCTRESWRAAPGPEGLEIRRLHPDSTDEELGAAINTVHRGFGDEGRDANPERIAEMRRRLGRGGANYLALLHGAPVGVGAYTAPFAGLTELVGIATLSEHRRQGIAAAVTSEMARQSFEEGVHTAFLTAADDDASRVYQRAGFWRIGTGLAFWEAAT